MVLRIIFCRHTVDGINACKKPVDFKLRNVRRGIRAASQENLIVSEVEIGPDGTIHIHTTPPGEKSHDTELDKWLGEHPNAGQAQGHQ